MGTAIYNPGSLLVPIIVGGVGGGLIGGVSMFCCLKLLLNPSETDTSNVNAAAATQEKQHGNHSGMIPTTPFPTETHLVRRMIERPECNEGSEVFLIAGCIFVLAAVL